MLCFILSVLTSGGCGQTISRENELARLQGKWEIVASEPQGKNIPVHLSEQYEFAGDRYRITRGPDSIGRWIKFELDVTKDPKRISWVVKVMTHGKTVKERRETLIYRMNADELQICLLDPDDTKKPTPYRFLVRNRTMFS